MASDWKFCKIGDVAKIQGGYAFKSKDFSDTGTPVIKIKNVRKRDIDLTDVARVSQEVAEQASSFLVKSWDVLISMTGSGPNAPASIVGRVARHSGEDDVFLINQRVGRFLIKEKEQLDQRFLYYLFSEDKTQLELLSIATGSANQVNISGKQIESIEVNLPPLSEQKAIAHVLGSLDDKIELNRQMNETLEAMAQALFKSWFVDFDPVIDNALAASNAIPDELLDRAEQRKEIEKKDNSDIQSLFPAEFEFTKEMGWIPKGWEAESFGDVSTCFDRLRVPLSKRERENKKPGIIPYHGATSVMDYINEWIFDDIYLLIGEDGSVIKEDGSPFVQYIWGKTWVNNHAHVLQGGNGVSTEHLMLFMQSQNLTAYITGAVQLKINQGNMNRIPFLNAGSKINEKFEAIINPFYEKLRSITEESQNLVKIRDTLLPKLMSGEVRIPDAEALVDEIL